jgi:hypothetical protein
MSSPQIQAALAQYLQANPALVQAIMSQPGAAAAAGGSGVQQSSHGQSR